MTTTVLTICHNHPSVRPGGAELYAYELHRAFDDVAGVRSVFLARGGPPVGWSGRHHEGTLVAPVEGRADDYFVFTDGYTYDWLNGTITDKDFYTHHIAAFLRAVRPDVVHVQHVNFIGYDLFRLIRNVLPDCVVVATLHEYSAICHRDGQLLRVRDDALCSGSSPRRCHECFPDVSAQQFFLRTRLIQSHLSAVDHFLSPSRFLRDRYVEWGIPADRISVEENGRVLDPPRPAPPRGRRDRFAFFGQCSPYKGVDVLLDAFALLATAREEERRQHRLALVAGTNGHADGANPRLTVHGANLDLQSGALRARVDELLAAAVADVTWVGPYRPADLPALMAATDWVVVPSIWWENSPLVIQEAAWHGRPVICSDIGGMAEKVTDDVDGLHFRAGDARDLAATIERAAGTTGLWERLHAAAPTVHPMAAHVAALLGLYAELGERRPAPLAVRGVR